VATQSEKYDDLAPIIKKVFALLDIAGGVQPALADHWDATTVEMIRKSSKKRGYKSDGKEYREIFNMYSCYIHGGD
jgi:hypothetical protein